MPKLIIQLMNEEWTVDLQVGSNVLGRASTCGVPLKDPSLSRQHCDIVFVGGNATVVDKGSLNGTLVNGRKVSEHALQPGDKIVIGASTIWYEKKNVAVERKPGTGDVRKPAPAAPPDPSASSNVATRRALSAATPAAPSRVVAPQTATPPPSPVGDTGQADEILGDYVYRGRSGGPWLKIIVTAAVLAAVGIGAYWAKDLLSSAPVEKVDLENVIRNGSFAGMGPGKPEGWTVRALSVLGPADRAASTLGIDAAQGRNGGPCMVLEKSGSSGDLAVECAYGEDVGLGHSGQVRAESWVRADGFGGRIAFKIDWLRGSRGAVVAEEFSEPHVAGASGWTRLSATLTRPAGAGAFRIAIAAVGRVGRIYVDDVLVKTEPASGAPREKKLGQHRAMPTRQGVLSLALRGRSTALLNIGVRLENDKEGATSQAFATDVQTAEEENGLRFTGKMLHPADLREIDFEGRVEAVQGGTAVYYLFKPEVLRQVDRVTLVATLPKADGVGGIPERPQDGTSRLTFPAEEGDAILEYSDLARIRTRKAEGRLRVAQSFAADPSGTEELAFGFKVREAGAGGGSLDPAADAVEARKRGQLGTALSILRGLVKTVKEAQVKERMEAEIRGLEESERRDWVDVQSQVFHARLTRRPEHLTRAQSVLDRYLGAWAGEGAEGKAKQLREEMQKELAGAAEGESERPRRIFEGAKKCAESGKKALAEVMLQTLISRYPQSDVIPEAQQLLKGLGQ